MKKILHVQISMILCDGNVKNVVQEWKIRIVLEHFRA